MAVAIILQLWDLFTRTHTRTHTFVCIRNSNTTYLKYLRKIAYLHFSKFANAIAGQLFLFKNPLLIYSIVALLRKVITARRAWTSHAHSFCGHANTRKDSKRLRLRNGSCCAMVYTHVVMAHRTDNGIGGENRYCRHWTSAGCEAVRVSMRTTERETLACGLVESIE